MRFGCHTKRGVAKENGKRCESRSIEIAHTHISGDLHDICAFIRLGYMHTHIYVCRYLYVGQICCVALTAADAFYVILSSFLLLGDPLSSLAGL